VSARQTYNFKSEPQAVRAARGALDAFRDDFPNRRLYDASLCVTELVTNAVQHAPPRGRLELTLAVDDDRIRVEVVDPGGGFDPGPSRKGDEGGWGLMIVDRLADDWGVEAGERTTVWFEMARGNGRLPTR
jgi:anti-sigma regulatory factor (Ser/Thr protein kinase)